ncbi:lysosomal cholesterol signaling protein isoform X2 [Ambystoma mexicanum]|uniref:lysosomal cholesterol signaling protein isoform X2 n=1 Tax=Ambystoma mexicanum TaxID=8296 RepID=UPI0037E7E95D
MESFPGVGMKNFSSIDLTQRIFGEMNNQSNGTNSNPCISINRLFPALLECFGIILCGYIAGRVNLITPTQSKGLGNFVSRFALPALLFKNMVVLDFSNVNWSFLYSILIAKASVFFIVCGLTLLVASPDTRFSKAGLFPIFATQSNDFALGYPIVEALYKSTYPEYLQYIYLVAPVSLMMLNPIGFIFCEFQKWRDHPIPSQNKIKIVGYALLHVFQNPIILMVFIGIGFNFILGQKIPLFMENFIDGLASSFSGSALFFLGLTMVSQTKKLDKSAFVALLLLITAKLLVLPLICREMVELLDKSSSLANHTSLVNYAFLYGVFPAAPGVAIFANHFNMEVQLITSGMVISTFVSAPIMYVSAWLLTIPSMDPKPLLAALQNVSFDISIVGLLSLVWSITVIVLSKKYKRLPHMLTSNLLLAQLIVCIGMIIWIFVTKEGNSIGQTLVFILLYTSLYSTYLWTGLISLTLFLLRKQENLKIPAGFIILVGWGVPALVVGILLMAGHRDDDNIDSAFFYGKYQIISTSVILFCSILMSSISLMCMSRTSLDGNYQVLDQSSRNGSIQGDEPERAITQDHPPIPSTLPSRTERGCSTCPVENGELSCSRELMASLIINNSPATETALSSENHCASRCVTQGCILSQEEQHLQSGDPQLARHVLLCLFLMVGLFANLSSCLWWLFNLEPGRLYLELQFFCAVFNFGQGFISFGVFGLDKHLIILPCKKRLEFLWGGREVPADSGDVAVPEEIRMTCNQFVNYHKDHCVRSIVKDKSADAKLTEHVGESLL